MSTFYAIAGQNESATVSAAFDDVKRVLLQNSQWAAHVLDVAGRSGARVAYAKVYGAVLGSQVVAEGPGYFLIRGTAGKNTRLMYRVEAAGEHNTRITPEGRAEGIFKVLIPIGLLFLCCVGVALTPLAYKARAAGMRRMSSKYLDAFCRYLEARLNAAAPEGQ